MSGEPVGGYGDPQHDGPAATALVLLALVADPRAALQAARPYLDHLLSEQQPGYDLWELVRGRSAHAEQLRQRALHRAADLAELVDDPSAARLRAAGTAVRLDDFRRGQVLRHVLEADPPWFDLLPGVDASTVGAVLLAAPADEPLPGLTDRGVEAVVDALVAHSARRGSSAVMRFPEDTNDGLGSTGGRPWPVATLWVAQWYLRRSRLSGVADPTADRARGLHHLRAVLASDPTALGEQLDWRSGAARGARPLAWSHAELVQTLLLL
jgi:GH15 family glucan-1,4-alpha-glucosidase